MARILNRKREEKQQTICAPVSGEATALSEVNDPAFAGEMLGKGMAIRPEDGRIAAPCDAVVEMLFETEHAVSLRASSGVEILIHVGLNTVNLRGKHFFARCRAGDAVKKGQCILEFDREAISREGYDTVVPVVVLNSGDFQAFEVVTQGRVLAGDAVIRLG